MGKTALAITVAAACSRDFPGGVTVVWLGSLRSADLVAAEVAVQLGLPRSGGQSYEDALTRWLSERDVLLGPDASLEEALASPAVQLFRERAGAQARGALDTERARRLFGDICRRVDGLPLAIELAAARVAGLDLEDIASHLEICSTCCRHVEATGKRR